MPSVTRSAADGANSEASHLRVAQEQRMRIMRALVDVLAEHGFAGATVGLVLARARASSRTFYQLFDGLEDCLVGVMDRVLEQVVVLASRELEGAECWQDGLRAALAAVLAFFDSDPELAQVCIVQTLAGGPVVLEHRERVVGAFRLPVVERIEREVSPVSPLTAEGVMSSVLGIMHAHMVARKPGRFIELLGPLMGLATAPYLGARGVEREIEQGDELAREILSGDSRRAALEQPTRQETGQGGALPAMLDNPNARRPRECLIFIAEHPNSSGREVAAGIGVAHQSQISRLLAYLVKEKLVTKCSEGAGKRNAWRLTPRGEEIARALSEERQ
jgi:AcrR family transcriptional regulator